MLYSFSLNGTITLSGQADMTPPLSLYNYVSPPVITQNAKNNVKVDLNKAVYSSAETLETQGTGVCDLTSRRERY